jgi:SAM-dependent methyltransferase
MPQQARDVGEFGLWVEHFERNGPVHATSVVCFTMLHHVPTPQLQDQLFAEAFRVLQPAGVFAGSDGVPSIPFRIAHVRDTCNPVSPDSLPDRLRHAGFSDVHVDVARGEQRWRAVNPD